MNYLFLAILVVIIIVIIFALYKYMGGDNVRRKRARKLINGSCGTFDQKAKDALQELDEIKNMTAGDNYHRGALIEYNILDGAANRQLGVRENRRLIGEVAQNYTHALQNMATETAEVDNLENNIFMLNRIGDFDRRMAAARFPAVDAAPNLEWQMEILDDVLVINILQGMHNVLTAVDDQVRQNDLDARIEDAAQADTRGEAVQTFFEKSAKYTSDAQNVHDGKVNDGLRKVLAKLLDEARIGNPGDQIAECRAFIRSQSKYGSISENAANDANLVLDTIAKGAYISTYDCVEDLVFSAVWERCKHEKNRKNAKLMREAVVTALADSVEGETPVCINGRCARLLNCFATLDFDSTVAASAMTYEAYRAQIFDESRRILLAEVGRAKASSDAKMRAIGESYDGGKTELDPQTEAEFNSRVSNAIVLNLENYSGRLRPAEIEQIKKECLAAVNL